MRRGYACVRQNDQSDCGAAALATVALHYRRPISLQQLRELAGTDRRGTNLLGLVQAATALGFTAKGVKGTYEVLPQAPLPAIVHVKTQENLGHFVVLYRVTPKKVIVADPACGLKTLSREEFCQSWTGYVPAPRARVSHFFHSCRPRASATVAAVSQSPQGAHRGAG